MREHKKILQKYLFNIEKYKIFPSKNNLILQHNLFQEFHLLDYIFHFLKAVHYENHSERQIFTANHRIERHTGHQNHHRDTPIRQVQIDAGLY